MSKKVSGKFHDNSSVHEANLDERLQCGGMIHEACSECFS